MYIYDRKPFHVAAAPHQLQAAMVRNALDSFCRRRRRRPARARPRPLHRAHQPVYTRRFIPQTVCQRLGFHFSPTWESRKCVIWVDFILYTGGSTNPGESAHTHTPAVGFRCFRDWKLNCEGTNIKDEVMRAWKMGQNWKTPAEWQRCWNIYTQSMTNNTKLWGLKLSLSSSDPFSSSV